MEKKEIKNIKGHTFWGDNSPSRNAILVIFGAACGSIITVFLFFLFPVNQQPTIQQSANQIAKLIPVTDYNQSNAIIICTGSVCQKSKIYNTSNYLKNSLTIKEPSLKLPQATSNLTNKGVFALNCQQLQDAINNYWYNASSSLAIGYMQTAQAFLTIYQIKKCR